MTPQQLERYRHLVSTVETGTIDALRAVLQDLGADRLDVLNSAVGDEPSDLSPMFLAVSRAGRPDVLDSAAGDEPSDLPPLFVAVSSGDPAKVDLLLEGGARLDVRGPNDLPILMHAYRERQIAFVNHLIARGADFRAMNQFGTRVLDAAIRAGHLPAIEQFLAAGVPLDHKGYKGRNVLHYACASGDVDVLDFVLARTWCRLDEVDENAERPIDRSSSFAMYLACLERQPELALDQTFTDGDHAIHRFARRGAADIVAYQLDHGVPLDLRGRERNTVLHYAVGSKDARFVRTLIERGAKLEARNGYAFRPLHWAAEAGSIEVVRALVEAGAKLDVKTSVYFIITETRTPLYIAVEARHLDVARYLLERGADPNIVCDTSHNSALTEACRNDDTDAVALLLQHGAQPNGLQVEPWTDFASFPLGDARSAEVVDLLVAAGADVKARQRYGDTALHCLAQVSWMSDPDRIMRLAGAIEALIRHGADPDDCGGRPFPPAMFADTAEVFSALTGGPARKPAGLGLLLLETARDASDEGKLGLLIYLLEHADAFDLNYGDSHDETLLMRIVEAMDGSSRDAPLTRYVEIVNWLLDRGASVDPVETLFGENVLHKLCRLSLEDASAADVVLIEAVAERLIAAGVPLNLENDEGSHALDLVRWISLFDLLQRHGATLGRTHVALFAAMEAFAHNTGTLDEVDALLAAGVPLESRSPQGDTPFLFAARLDSIELLDHLAHKGADQQARDTDDLTALHVACAFNAMNAAEWLIRHGAAIDARDAEGRTPLEWTKTKALRTKLARIAKAADKPAAARSKPG